MSNFKKSFYMIKDIKVIAITSILISLNIVLSFFSFNLGGVVIITFNFIIKALIGFMFGPFVSMFSGGISDIITFFVKPSGVYHFWFTFTAIISGGIYGFFLFNKKPTLKLIIITCLFETVVCSIFLNTIGLKLLYNKAIMVILPARITKSLILLPIEIFVIYFILKKRRVDK